MTTYPAIRPIPGGVAITCQVQPRASRSRFAGFHGDALKIQLAAPPVDGAANRELVQLLRKRIGLPAAGVIIRSGEQGRRKIVHLQGCTVAEVMAALDHQ